MRPAPVAAIEVALVLLTRAVHPCDHGMNLGGEVINACHDAHDYCIKIGLRHFLFLGQLRQGPGSVAEQSQTRLRQHFLRLSVWGFRAQGLGLQLGALVVGFGFT